MINLLRNDVKDRSTAVLQGLWHNLHSDPIPWIAAETGLVVATGLAHIF